MELLGHMVFFFFFFLRTHQFRIADEPFSIPTINA